MTSPRGRTLPVLVAALTLVGGANLAAYAANGKPLLLGKQNTETAATTVVNKGKGPALNLKSKPGTPSLAVSSDAQVPKLNADRVDGLEGAALQTRSYRFEIPATTNATRRQVTFPGLPPSWYHVSYSVSSEATAPVRCYLGTVPARGFSQSASTTGFHASSGSALLDARESPAVFTCWSTESFRFYNQPHDGVSEIVFTRVDQATEGVPVVSEPMGNGRGHGPSSGRP